MCLLGCQGVLAAVVEVDASVVVDPCECSEDVVLFFHSMPEDASFSPSPLPSSLLPQNHPKT